MLTLPTAVSDALASGSACLCYCWRVVRRDGAVFGFTDHDQDLVVSGQTYGAADGWTRSAQAAGVGLDDIAETQVDGVVGGSITLADLLAGRWDGATVETRLVEWQSRAAVVLAVYRIGEIAVAVGAGGVGTVTFELRGVLDRLRQRIGDVYTPRCRAQFGDLRCRAAVPSADTAVAAVVDRQVFSGAGVGDATAYVDGTCTFTAGANAGFSAEVIAGSGDQLTLLVPAPAEIEVGDPITITQGCDKAADTCRVRWGNLANFRGFPFIPGHDVAGQRGGR